MALISPSQSSAPSGSILLCSRICPDGLGDFQALIKTAKLFLNAKFNVQIIAAIPPEYDPEHDPNQRLRVKDIESIQTQFFTYEYTVWCDGVFDYASIKIPDAIKETLFKAAQTSSIIQIPVPFLHTCTDAVLFEGKSKKVWEYGYQSNLSQKDQEYALGLGETCVGIFIFDNPKDVSLTVFEKKTLWEILFNKQSIEERDIVHYKQDNKFFLAYIKNWFFQKLYFKLIVNANKKTKALDICLPIKSLDDLEISQDWMTAQNINKISLITPSKHTTVSKEDETEDGRTIRIINLFPFKPEDFNKLQIFSECPVGCTGDQSISELISFDQLFFYEIVPHKKYFFQDLIEYSIRTLETPDSPFILYLRLILGFYELMEKNMLEGKDSPQIIDAFALRMQEAMDSERFLSDYHLVVKAIKHTSRFNPCHFLSKKHE